MSITPALIKTFRRIAQKAIIEAETVNCTLDQFAQGMSVMEDEIGIRREAARDEVMEQQ